MKEGKLAVIKRAMKMKLYTNKVLFTRNNGFYTALFLWGKKILCD